MQLYELSLSELQEKLQKKEVSSLDITKSFIEKIEQVEDKVKAFITLDTVKALEKAKELDGESSLSSSIAGIPYALKDIICTRGMKTTCASKILENFVPTYNATVAEKLLEAEGVLLGKLNMDEFAMGSSTEQSAFHTTNNPWDLQRVPGGSSGGSAAAVAADEVPFSLGTDTGGSIRQPASYCGVVGLKPTYGRVSRYGVIAYASSLDQVGVFTRNVLDCANVLEIISGYDPKDSTSINIEVPNYSSALDGNVKKIKIAYPKEYFQSGVNLKVQESVKNALRQFEQMGAIVEEVSLPHSEYALPAYYLLAPAEASSNLARYDGVRYGYRDEQAENVLEMYAETRSKAFGAEVKRRIMLGTYALSAGYYDAYYLKALKVRSLVKQDFDKVFEKYDIIVCPTTPTTAFKLNEQIGDPLSLYMNDVLTVPVNMAGLPGISIPCGFIDGLPVGMQIIAKPFDELTILKAAYAFEQNNNYHIQRPVLGGDINV